MTIKEIQKQIQNGAFSADDLRVLNHIVVAQLKLQRNMESISMASRLSVGDKVKVNHPKCYGRTYEIKEIKRTKAVLMEPGNPFRSIKCPMNLIQAA